MKFEIDVSGDDIFNEGYVICIAGEEGTIKGFKFKKELIEVIISNWKSKRYGYETSDRGRGFFKVKLYCVILYYLFKSTGFKNRILLTICRDFHGHVNDINNTLRYFLEKRLNFQIGSPRHQKLPDSSHAHRYAKIMYNDKLNILPTYVNISLEDIEKLLKRYKKK